MLFGLAGAPALAASPLIWAFGDSLTAGYGLPPADGFTSQLERALRGAGVPAKVRNGRHIGRHQRAGPRAAAVGGCEGLAQSQIW